MSVVPAAISFTRQLGAGLRMLIVLTLLLGVGYPLVLLGAGQAVAHDQANGSLLHRDGGVVGSSLIGQSFAGPSFFQSRPSTSDYSGDTSGGSNLAASDPRQQKVVAERRAALAKASASAGAIAPDALTASASGLDPDISPAYARSQVARVAAARGMSVAAVQALVDQHTQGRVAGFLGEPRVDVLELNVALQR